MKALHTKSWAEMQREMSLAGQPGEVVELAKKIMAEIVAGIDMRNPPSIDNMEYALDRISAELRLMRRIEMKRQHP